VRRDVEPDRRTHRPPDRELDGREGQTLSAANGTQDLTHFAILLTSKDEPPAELLVCHAEPADGACDKVEGIHHGDAIEGIRVSEAGDRVLVLRHGTVELWDVKSSRRLRVFGHDTALDAAYVSGSPRVVTGSTDGTVRVWDGARFILQEKAHEGRVTAGKLEASGRWLVTGGRDGTVLLWDLGDKSKVVMAMHKEAITSIAFRTDVALDKLAPTDPMFVTASTDSTARVWTREGKQKWVLRGHGGDVNMASFDDRGRFLLTAADDGLARVWDARSGRLLLELSGHTGWLPLAGFAPGGERVVTGGSDGAVRLWDMRPESRPPSVIEDLVRQRLPTGNIGGE
jgi:WD40 repeat protein